LRKKSFLTKIATLEFFSNISGHKLNKGECTVLKLGSLRNNLFNFCNDDNFNWTSKKGRRLGITFIYNIDANA
jgi:hypothetical protein